jgi:hypothetical protein
VPDVEIVPFLKAFPQRWRDPLVHVAAVGRGSSASTDWWHQAVEEDPQRPGVVVGLLVMEVDPVFWG